MACSARTYSFKNAVFLFISIIKSVRGLPGNGVPVATCTTYLLCPRSKRRYVRTADLVRWLNPTSNMDNELGTFVGNDLQMPTIEPCKYKSSGRARVFEAKHLYGIR